MNIEDYREFCLSLGADVEEKLPFQKFKSGEGVLVFYVMGHMFSFFDCNDFSVISLKCQPERIEDLKAQYECIGKPYNEMGIVDRILTNFDRTAGLFHSVLYTKLFAVLLLALSCLGTKGVKEEKITWPKIWIALAVGFVLFFQTEAHT